MAGKIVARGKWKCVEVDPNTFLQKDMEHFVCMEELTDYEIVSGDNIKKQNKLEPVLSTGKVKKKKRRRTETSQSHSRESHSQVDCDAADDDDDVGVSAAETSRKSGTRTVAEPTNKCDMSAWENLHVPDPVLRSLQDLEFSAPTPIQALTLPPAIRDRLDIVGAAETGSGKTLAFVIPLIHHILEDKERAFNTDVTGVNSSDADDDDDDDSDDDTDGDEDDEDNDSSASEDEKSESDEDEMMECDDVEESNREDEAGVGSSSRQAGSFDSQPLYAVILTPTRELAIQVHDHIKAVTKHTDIKSCVIVGGMSIQKQTRLLLRCPEIVVATPGRLWQLVEQGNNHLSKVTNVRYLVIDEADRMVEKGHFQELTSLLQLINNQEGRRPQHRQTFVFSATLTFVPTKPQRLEFAKKKKVPTATLR